ncbi:MAG: pyridoxamine 5'-phosphate oxidase family protein [Sphaerochaetaceae bacterium]|nr:pyridoxamine 5'-phosphate oxidase family protein [Sphaerochaetaceae bacterium]
MFREMRRKERQIGEEECISILKNEKRAVFSVMGDDGYPYTVPVNFVYNEKDGNIYFHCALQGHKIDSIRKNDKVCFTVMDGGVKSEKDWSYYVKSVVVFGRASIMEEGEDKKAMCRLFGEKYIPTREELDQEMEHAYPRVNMVRIKIEDMKGKRVHEK